MFAVTTSGGSAALNGILTLTDSYQQIVFTGKNLKGFLLQTRNGGAFRYSTIQPSDKDTLVYISVPSNQVFAGTFTVALGVIGWARYETSADTLEYIVMVA